jgi:undecaprenyl-diphosphatase
VLQFKEIKKKQLGYFYTRLPSLHTLDAMNSRAVAIGWTLVLGGGKLVEAVLKHTFQRTRPIGALQHLGDQSYSYPSGHAMGAMIGYGVLAYLVLLRVRRPMGRAAVTAAAALTIIAIGLSRLVLGVHFFTDVIGGYAAGAVWLALSLTAAGAARDGFAGTVRGHAEHHVT